MNYKIITRAFKMGKNVPGNIPALFSGKQTAKGLFTALILCWCSSGIGQITRTQILNNARPYIPYIFTASSANIWSNVNCSAVGNILTPSWVAVGSNQHMPYCWGGFSTLSSFTSGLTASKSAGDDDCTTGGDCCESCALGVDCSGFVSRAWGLTTKYSTTTLTTISTAYSSPTQVLPGDIFDYSGSHTRLVDTNYNNGNYKVMESSANGWDVSYNTYTTAQLTSYTPRWYVKVTNPTVTPNYISSVSSGCAGVKVNYTDQSTTTSGTITAWKWTFPGGTPSSSTLQNPTVTYNTPGTYNVTEVVTATSGVDSITNLAYITVIPTGSLPLSEGFQSSTFPPAGWTMHYPSPDDSAWELCTTTGYNSSQCMYYPGNCGQVVNIAGERQQLYTPGYSFAGVTNAELSFDVAYEPSDVTSTPAYSDTLVVYYSTDCGNTWTSIYSKGGMALCTTGSTTSGGTDINGNGCFVPPNNKAWRTDSVSLSMLNGDASVMFSFESRSGWGNIIYLDNINIATPPLSVQNMGESDDVKVYPNPNNGSFTIQSSVISRQCSVEVYDALGQQVYHAPINTGITHITLDNKAAGMYFYRIMTETGDKLISEGKLMIQ
ncbi:MAG: T9SS type A sorting domain-containing protein [Bacteroidia bacterium]